MVYLVQDEAPSEIPAVQLSPGLIHKNLIVLLLVIKQKPQAAWLLDAKLKQLFVLGLVRLIILDESHWLSFSSYQIFSFLLSFLLSWFYLPRGYTVIWLYEDKIHTIVFIFLIFQCIQFISTWRI